MKRLLCVWMLLLPLAGCALFEDCVAFSEQEWHKYADDGAPPAGQVRACGDGAIMQAGAVQTAEPQLLAPR